MFFFLPEVKDRTLEEIDEMVRGNADALVTPQDIAETNMARRLVRGSAAGEKVPQVCLCGQSRRQCRRGEWLG